MAEKNEETPENADTARATADDTADAADAVSVEAAGATADEGADAGDAASAEEAPTEETPAEEPVAEGDEAGTVPAEAEEPAAKPKAAPKSGPTRREKLEAKRAERQVAAGRRKPRTPEERDAERRERRAALAKQRRAYRQRLKTKKAEARKAAPAAEELHAPEHGPGRAKVRQGVVVSDKGEKTITVAIDVVKRHKRYHKIMRSTVKLYAHDERNDAHPGDTVRVQECRPMSRSKRWRLVEVLERAK
jgi:small subunit ribosomal protein S17